MFNNRGLSAPTSILAARTGLKAGEWAPLHRSKDERPAACVAFATDRLMGFLAAAEAEPTPQARLRRFIGLFFEAQAMVGAKAQPDVFTLGELRSIASPGALVAQEAAAAVFRRLRFLFEDPSGPWFSRREQNARAFLVFASLLHAVEWLNQFDPEEYQRCADHFADIMVDGLAVPDASWAPGSGRLSALVLPEEDGRKDAFLRMLTERINERGYRGAAAEWGHPHETKTNDDLVADCFERSFEVIRAAHQVMPPDTGSGWRRLSAITVALVRYQYSSYGPLLHSMAIAAMPPSMRVGIRNTFCALANRTAGVIVDGMADGSIRPVDPFIATRFISGMVNTAQELKHWAVDVTPDAALDLFARPALFGIFSFGA